MVAVPAAIIYINSDTVTQVQEWIAKQLHISETIDGYVFDQRVAADPEYVNKIKQLDLRLLVRRAGQDFTNRNLADVVIFVINGLASILENKFGPPGQTYEVLNLYWGQLFIY